MKLCQFGLSTRHCGSAARLPTLLTEHFELIDVESWSLHADSLIGVIDLKDGLAVHGIAGIRERYLPVGPLRCGNSMVDGQPAALLEWYRTFGIHEFYLADLDALMGGATQTAAIESLLQLSDRPAERWMIDVGIHASTIDTWATWIRGAAGRLKNVDWIVASESATSVDLIDAVVDRIDPLSLILGVDFRAGQFVGPRSGLDAWISTAAGRGLTRALVLDVAAVGTGKGPIAASRCRDLHQRYPNWGLISGGGCRSVQDVATFLRAGCTGCLIASALLPSAREQPS